MSNSSAATPSVPVPAAREVVVDFSPEVLQAPFLLRLGSMIIDYLVLVLLPAASLFYARIAGEPLGVMTDRTMWLLSGLLFLANIIVIPLFTGRSLGKMLTGLRIVRFDGTEPGIGVILLRQTLGYLVTAITLGIGFLLCVFSVNGRTLHDVLTGTMVVQGRRRIA